MSDDDPTSQHQVRAGSRWRDGLGRWRAWLPTLATQGRLLGHLLEGVLLGAAAGLLAGTSSWAFLEALTHVTAWRLDRPWLLFLLPVAAFAVGAVYHYLGGRSAGGNVLLIEEIHQPTRWLPRRMAPLVLGGTLVSHLFGASVGREGTALQMSGSLADGLARTLRLDNDRRKVLLVASIGGGFGAVFGVPLAGAVFALEVQAIGRIRYEAFVPALTASIIGDLVVRGLGYHHGHNPELRSALDAVLVAKVAVAGMAFGLAAAAFVELAHALKELSVRWITWTPLRPALGGFATIGLALLFGRQYLGLSVPLIGEALGGGHIEPWVFALKLLFTAVALGSGIPGGEVTPLFVIGATLGSTLAGPLHLPAPLLAAVGFVAVFAGAANTPLACTVMGAELFGSGLIAAFAVGCVLSYIFSDHRGIYESQRILVSKGGGVFEDQPSLAQWRTRRHQRKDEPPLG